MEEFILQVPGGAGGETPTLAACATEMGPLTALGQASPLRWPPQISGFPELCLYLQVAPCVPVCKPPPFVRTALHWRRVPDPESHLQQPACTLRPWGRASGFAFREHDSTLDSGLRLAC